MADRSNWQLATVSASGRPVAPPPRVETRSPSPTPSDNENYTASTDDSDVEHQWGKRVLPFSSRREEDDYEDERERAREVRVREPEPERIVIRERPERTLFTREFPERTFIRSRPRSRPRSRSLSRYRDRQRDWSEEDIRIRYRGSTRPLEKARVLQQIVRRIDSSTVRKQDLDWDTAICVYYDAIDSSTEAPYVAAALDPLHHSSRRPWMVQLNGSFLVSLLQEVTNTTLSLAIQFIPAPFKLLVPYEKEIEACLEGLNDSDKKGWKGRMIKCLLEVIRVDLRLCSRGDVVVSENNEREQLYTVYSLQADHGPRVREREREEIIIREAPSGARRQARRYYDPENYSDEEDTAVQEDEDYPPLMLRCYYAVYDGVLVGPACRELVIPYFSREKSIFDLPAYPVSIHPDADTILKRFRDRGRKFISLQGHKHYDGVTVAPDQYRKIFLNEEVNGEVYVDVKTGYRMTSFRSRPSMTKPDADLTRTRGEPDFWGDEAGLLSDRTLFVNRVQNQTIDKRRGNDFVNSHSSSFRIISKDKALKLQEYLQLLPHQLLTFVFRLRSWKFLDIDSLREIDKSEAAAKSGFDDLVIPEAYRDLLISVIESHKSGSIPGAMQTQSKMASQMDIVRGKGRGLIILLHGPPGVGKTSTAETIAAYSRRPLYPLTCGDIGLTPDQIEESLNYHFSLASQWGCIMLIDEADVFLMKRDWHDINRNALVSVFLRVLEYYSGILFLTTNRIGVIDEAFKSRMHLYLRYPTIDLDSTKEIWGRLLDRIMRDNKENPIKIEFERSSLIKYAVEHYQEHEKKKTTWNARQIRNAFQTAIAMGQYDRVRLLTDNDMTEEQASERGSEYMRVRLCRENFERIATATKDFDSFMISVRGGSDQLKAREEGLRDDEFDPDRPPAAKQYNGLSVLATVSRS